MIFVIDNICWSSVYDLLGLGDVYLKTVSAIGSTHLDDGQFIIPRLRNVTVDRLMHAFSEMGVTVEHCFETGIPSDDFIRDHHRSICDYGIVLPKELDEKHFGKCARELHEQAVRTLTLSEVLLLELGCICQFGTFSSPEVSILCADTTVSSSPGSRKAMDTPVVSFNQGLHSRKTERILTIGTFSERTFRPKMGPRRIEKIISLTA